MTIGRRPPGNVPGFEQLMNKGGPQDLRRVGALLDQAFLHMGESSYNGLPNTPDGESTEAKLDQVEMLGWLAWQRADEL